MLILVRAAKQQILRGWQILREPADTREPEKSVKDVNELLDTE